MTSTTKLLLAIPWLLVAACSNTESADNPGDSADRQAPASAAAPTNYTLAPGTLIDATTTTTISSQHGQAGDPFTAVVASDVLGAGGAVAIPAGSTVQGSITEVSPAASDRSLGTLTLAVSSVTVRGKQYDLDASIDSLVTVNETRGIEKADAARVAGGAAAGAIIGQVIGGNTKGTIIGAVSGAAVGAAVSVAVKDVDIVLPQGAHLMLTLRKGLTVAAK